MTAAPTLNKPWTDRDGLVRSTLSGTHPGRLACALLAVDVIVVGAGAFVTRAVTPDMSPLMASLIVTAVLTVVVTMLVWQISGFRAAGFTAPGRWRNLRLLILPAVLAMLPLTAGVRPVDRATLLTLLVGYALTGFMEEALWRGLVLRVLTPTGALPAVLLSAGLFGASHVPNVLFRDSVMLVAAQAVGAFCFGVGYAAVAQRIGTIWPLMVLHLLTDLCAAIGALPKIPVLVGQDVVLLIAGLVLVRRAAMRPADPARVRAVAPGR